MGLLSLHMGQGRCQVLRFWALVRLQIGLIVFTWEVKSNRIGAISWIKGKRKKKKSIQSHPTQKKDSFLNISQISNFKGTFLSPTQLTPLYLPRNSQDLTFNRDHVQSCGYYDHHHTNKSDLASSALCPLPSCVTMETSLNLSLQLFPLSAALFSVVSLTGGQLQSQHTWSSFWGIIRRSIAA